MSRGPKPAPTALKILAGTRADRVNQAEPPAAPGIPETPCELSPRAAEIWADLAPRLAGMRILTEADGIALAALCEAVAAWEKSGRKLRRDGLLTATAAGGLKPNPLAAIHREHTAQLFRSLAEFGLTPSARSRVAALAEPERDPIADLIAKHRKA